MDAYYKTEQLIDGRLWLAGEVVRLWPDTNHGAFGDAVILGFNDDGLALLGRPYGYVSCSGTTGPNLLVGFERIAMYKLTKELVVGSDRIAR